MKKKSIFIISFLVGLVMFSGCGKSDSKRLDDRLTELGNAYYKKYYGLIEEDKRTEFLAKYNTLGIKVDLENLARTVADTDGLPSKDELLKEFTKDGKECKLTTSKLIFYPQEPYGENDFKLDMNLDCGEDKK